jgi:peptidoglycan hydrolase-like protein with peptidoglycan-binding domain
MLRLFDGAAGTLPQLADSVKQLQQALNQVGLPVTVDGIFGSSTEAAVRLFQLNHNLHDDGIVGPATWAALPGMPSPDLSGLFGTSIATDDPAMLDQLAAAANYQDLIEDAANASGFQPAVIAGIGSRESGWGLLLKPEGPAGTGDFSPRKPNAPRDASLPPDGGFGRGLMQIDYDVFPFARTGNWQDPQANINFGCNVLQAAFQLIQRKSPLTGTNLLEASIAAYNCGAGNVLKALQDNRDVDFYTAGRNYSSDVINRAGFFQNHGW